MPVWPQIRHGLLMPSAAASFVLLLAVAGCDRLAAQPQAESSVVAPTAAKVTRASTASSRMAAFVGSKTCFDCHAKFYELWSTSRHGLAMQPYSAAFARKELKPQAADVTIGGQSFRAEIGENQGWVREKDGPQ